MDLPLHQLRRGPLVIVSLIIVLAAMESRTFGQTSTLSAPLTDFIKANCLDCHTGGSTESGLDLSRLAADLSQTSMFATWVEIHDRVRSGEMPPPGEVEIPEPMRQRFLELLQRSLHSFQYHQQRLQGRVPMRRLNRVEFENTMRDLFAMPGLQVRDLLPEDRTLDGFDKASDALDVSAAQLRKYLEAIDFVLDEAVAHEAKPMLFQERFRLVGGLAQFGEATFPVSVTKTEGPTVQASVDLDFIDANVQPKRGSERRITLTERLPHVATMDSLGLLTHARPSWDAEVKSFSPFHSGFYRIKTSLWSFDYSKGEVSGTQRMQSFALTANGRVLAYLDAPSLKPQEHEVVVWLNAGETLQLNPANLWGNFGNPYGWVGPAVAVDYVDVEGPLHDSWPPESHRRLFGDLPLAELPFKRGNEYPRQPKEVVRKPGYRPNHTDGDEFKKWQTVWTVATPRPEADAIRLLNAFLPRAFRRPVSEDVINIYVRIAHERIDAGDFFEDAMRAAYRTALCSPDFLFLQEPTGIHPSDPMSLDNYTIASRLSYFLWNSMPDDELLQLASKNQLGGQKLAEQVNRMLADSNSDRFVEDFLDQWLDLRDINFTSPDRKLYPEFRNDLRDAMLAETRAYFREMLEKNLGASHVVDSDFVMVNQRLAEVYGISGVEGSAIRRVTLPEGSPRGGLLTHASVLKVTANGTVTSPVKRGAWVMDRILGRPPQPPPPNIPAVDPDVRGTTTIREQLRKHRSEPVCAGCHAKMDPPGFALESFDVMGRWRDQYRFEGEKIEDPADRRGDDPPMEHFMGVSPFHWPFVTKNVRYGLPVDASGTTADGKQFRDIHEFKQLLLADEEALARNLVERLVLYATGMPVSFADRKDVEQILSRSKASGYGLRTLIDEIMRTQLFRKR